MVYVLIRINNITAIILIILFHLWSETMFEYQSRDKGLKYNYVQCTFM